VREHRVAGLEQVAVGPHELGDDGLRDLFLDHYEVVHLVARLGDVDALPGTESGRLALSDASHRLHLVKLRRPAQEVTSRLPNHRVFENS